MVKFKWQKDQSNLYSTLILYGQLVRERISAVAGYFIEGEKELMNW
jgi:hypothetical protein